MESNPNKSQIAADASGNPPNVKMLINGQFVDSMSSHWDEVSNPATQEVLAKVPFSTSDEIDTAVAAAGEAFKTWRNTAISNRARLFFRFQELIRKNMDRLAASVTAELGKTGPDALYKHESFW